MLFAVNERTESGHWREITSPFWRFSLDERLDAFAYEPSQLFRATLKTAAEGLGEPTAVRLRVIPTQAVIDRAAFVTDVERAARLQHPGVACIIEYGAHDGYDFVAEEWIGESLATALTAYGRIAEKHALLWLRQIATVLDQVHAAGLIHGHLTPHACLMTDDGRVKLGDFGLRMALSRMAARAYYPSGADGGIVPASMLTARDDQYALAAIAFEIITGRPLPSGDSTSLYRFSARSALAQYLPPATGVVIARALSADPESRYSDCAAFVDALARAAGAPFDASAQHSMASPAVAESTQPGAPRLGLATALGGLLALGVLAAFALLMTGGGSFADRVTRLLSGEIAVNQLGASVAAQPVRPANTGWPFARSDERNSGFAQMPVADVLRLSWQAGVGADGLGGVVLSEGRVVLNRTLDTVGAYDARNGTPLWSASFGAGVVDTPVIHRGGVLVGLRDGSVVSIDAQTGAVRWTHNALLIEGWPRITARDGVVYAATTEGHIYALSAADGAQLWHLRLPGREAITLAPAVGSGALFVVTGAPQLMRIDIESRMIVWRQALTALPFSAPAISDRTEIVTLLTQDRQMIGLNAMTGSPIWTFVLDSDAAGGALQGDAAFVASTAGRLSALSLRTGALLWSGKADGQIASPPLIDDTHAIVAAHVGGATEIRYFERLNGGEDIERMQLIRDRVLALIAADGWIIARGAALYAYGPK
jgi:outer membrane protein assembly factor BamB